MKINRETRNAARKIFRACIKDGKLEESRMRQSIKIIADGKPRHYLGMLKELERLTRAETHKRTLTVETATPIEDAQKQELQKQVEARFGGPLHSKHRVNPKLIGGIRIQIGSNVWDGSVAARLEQLNS